MLPHLGHFFFIVDSPLRVITRYKYVFFMMSVHITTSCQKMPLLIASPHPYCFVYSYLENTIRAKNNFQQKHSLIHFSSKKHIRTKLIVILNIIKQRTIAHCFYLTSRSGVFFLSLLILYHILCNCIYQTYS